MRICSNQGFTVSGKIVELGTSGESDFQEGEVMNTVPRERRPETVKMSLAFALFSSLAQPRLITRREDAL
jgi:hypothetical protein